MSDCLKIYAADADAADDVASDEGRGRSMEAVPNCDMAS